MEEGSGYAGGDGDQFPLAVEDFDLVGAGELGKVDGAAAADAGGGGLVRGDGRKLRQEFAGMHEERFKHRSGRREGNSRSLHFASRSLRERKAPVGMTICCGVGMTIIYLTFDFFEGVGVADFELGHGGAAQRFEMRSGTETLAHFVRDRPHVGSRSDASPEAGAVALDCEDHEFFDLDLNRLEDYLLLFSRQFVGWDTVDFLGGERGRHLVDEAEKSGSEFPDGIEVESDRDSLAHRLAVGVIRIGGEAEADHAFVGFLRGGVELRQARETSGDEREHAGGERIQRAEMADGALLQNMAHAVDHVVRGEPGGLIDDDDAIHGGGFVT